MGLHWEVIKDRSGIDIGALGFLGNNIVIISTFYDYRDTNKDGNISLSEHMGGVFKLEHSQFLKVINAAQWNPNVHLRDGRVGEIAKKLTIKISAHLICTSVYSIYFRSLKSKLMRGKRIKDYLILEGTGYLIKKRLKLI